MTVHIVGAGPAGAIAAISAIRNAHSVVVSEEHPVAGLPRNCSGLFSKDGLTSLKGFVDYRKFIIGPIHGARIHFHDELFCVRRKKPVGFICDRSGIDEALAMRAESEGARIAYNERVDGVFKSDNIIGADGPLSSVASHFNFPKISRYASTLQGMVKHKGEIGMVELFFSNSAFPGFFAWVIPHDEYLAEFGVGVILPNRPRPAWERLMKMKGIHGAIKPKGAIIPLSVRKKTVMRIKGKSILLAGDAAGQVKSTTGGGVIFGGNCAALAGRYATDPLRYELEWKARYLADLSMHSMLHRYLSGLSDADMADLGRRLKKLNIDDYLSVHGHMDKPTNMLRPRLLEHMVRGILGF